MSLPVIVVKGQKKVNGYHQFTNVNAAAVKLAPGNNALEAILQAEAQDVRWRDDGTAPTANVGMLIKANESITYCGDLTAIQLIGTANGAILNASYYGPEQG